jgi:hypothetical protein
MTNFHIVQQGEHLQRIAEQHGFADYRIIWEHAKNAELFALRQNPNVLLPDDLIFIPEKERKKEAIPTGRRHSFRLAGEALKLRLALENADREAIDVMDVELSIDGQGQKFTVGDDGVIELLIPKTAEHGIIKILGREVPLEIGHLDPADELSGQMARLNNLGYGAGEGNDTQLCCAIEEFQCDYGLPVNGKCDSATQAKLKEVHGC